jgi:amino acid transporter
MAMVQEQDGVGLERRVLGPVEIFGQAVGNTGMATVVALTPVLVASSAGNGSWVSMLVAALAMLGVGYCAAIFGRRVATSGSLYTYTAQALGKGAAYLVGWALLIAYFGLAISIPPLGAEFLGQVFGQGDAMQIILYVALTLAATGMAFYGVRISTRTALLLEAISLTLLGIVLIATLVKSGTVADSAQLKLTGFGLHPLFLGITLSVTALVGFESGASLGAEARDPYRAIPRVILLTIAIAGVIYILAIYIENLGFHHLGQNIITAAEPTSTLGTWAGVNFLKYPIAIGLGFSFFAIMLACMNAMARMLYTMAREGVAPAAFGRVHPVRRSPYVGILALAPFLVVVAVVMKYVAKADPTSAFAYLATPSTFGFIFAYILIGVGAPLLVRRETGRWQPGVVLAAIVGIAAMIATYVANVTPVPPYPYNILPYIFLGLMIIGGCVYLWLRASRPDAVRAIGTVEEADDEPPVPAHPAFAEA